MKKVGIVRCQQTESICPGTTCLALAPAGKGAFEELGPCQIAGFVSCGGCPGKNIIPRAQAMKSRGVDAIALSSCMTLGSPNGFPCPNKDAIMTALRKALGPDFPILDHTHPFPKA